MSRSVVFVDSKVVDYQTLVAGLGKNIEVHLLTANQDGFTQIATALHGRKGLNAIHIISDGNSGELALGATVINSQNLASHSSALKQIGAALTTKGDILLYGCNVAQGATGQQFIKQLSQLSRADVSASTNLTGSAALGGDWVLEAHTGAIETTTLASPAYAHTLVTPVLSTVAGTTPVEGGAVGKFTITLDSPAPVGGLLVNYTLTGSTATLTTDYSVVAGTNTSAVTGSSFTIGAGFSTATLNISAVADGITDPSETVQLNITTGVDYQLTAGSDSATLTIADRATSHAPTATNSTVVIGEDSTYSFTVANFGLVDASDTPADNLLNVIVTSLPSLGSLKLNNVAVTLNQVISASNITAGLFTFTPALNGFATNYTNFNFKVQDDGGTANGGADTSTTINNLKFQVTAANDTPTATNLSAAQTYTEDTPLNLIDIVSADVDSPSLTATMTLSNPLAGSLNVATSGTVTSSYNAITGVWSASGVIANVNTLLAGLTFTPSLDFNSSFTLNAVISDGTQPTASGTKVFTGIAANDAPTATNLAIDETYVEDTPLNLTDIVVSDVDSAALTVTISLDNPLAGSLNVASAGAVTSSYNAGTGTWTATGNLADVNTLLVGLTFTPASNFNGDFTMTTTVNDSTLNVSDNKYFTGTPTNDLPTGSVNINNANPQQFETLKVTNTLADVDGLGLITYTWYADATAIGTGTSRVMSAAHVGKAIRVVANYTDAGGTAESVSSNNTNPVIVAGVTITPASVLHTSETGSTVSYAVRLSVVPSSGKNVVITFTSSDTTEGIVDTPTLTFTSSNWATTQNLTLRGVDDTLDDGAITYAITASITTTDVPYQNVTISPLSLINDDDGLDVPTTITGDVNSIPFADTLTGSNGNDTVYGLALNDSLSGGLGDDVIYCGTNNDIAFGETGNDTLYGEAGNDYLLGGDGDDALDGGLGFDVLNGGVGNDTYSISTDVMDSITDNGPANDSDTVITPYQLSRYILPANIENATIGAGTLNANLAGNASGNALTGNEGNNSLSGDTGNDTLTGNGGHDTLDGGVGNDSLSAGAGNDALIGGAGNDTLTGGAGLDSFRLFTTPNASTNVETITDFAVVDDSLQLPNSIFTALGNGTGALNSAFFVIGTAAVDSNDYFIYNTTTGAVFYDANGSGGGSSIQIALLGAGLALTNADFVVV